MKTSGCYITSMAPIIALFDIDGTLLRAGGAGRREGWPDGKASVRPRASAPPAPPLVGSRGAGVQATRPGAPQVDGLATTAAQAWKPEGGPRPLAGPAAGRRQAGQPWTPPAVGIQGLPGSVQELRKV
jgi:hypothetical protein